MTARLRLCGMKVAAGAGKNLRPGPRSNSCPGSHPAPGASMSGIVRIDDEVITTDDFIRTLKLSGQFEGLVEQMVRDRLTARAARQAGLQLKPEQIQERADDFRRAL